MEACVFVLESEYPRYPGSVLWVAGLGLGPTESPGLVTPIDDIIARYDPLLDGMRVLIDQLLTLEVTVCKE